MSNSIDINPGGAGAVVLSQCCIVKGKTGPAEHHIDDHHVG